jgi:CHRD domain-containing protein
MRRIAIALVLALAGTAAFATAEAGQTRAGAKKTALCHRTKAAKRPYVRIVVKTKAALRTHQAHHADIVPAPAGGCPRTAVTPTKGGVKLTATLDGLHQVPPGDLDGTGTATFRSLPGLGQICYTLDVTKIVLPATAAHIHLGENGNIVVPLNAPDANGDASGCANTSRALVRAILANPGGYYVNVHTSDYPNGAIRGTLTR